MASMTLDQLRIFLAVAEHLHFTRAAEALYITQPAVSAAIQSLEGEYGVKLFHRIGRQIEITEAGKLLQLEAEKIIEQVKLTERGLQELNNLQRGELKLGSSLTIGNYWLPEQLNRFQQQYPNISVKCFLANTEEICEGTVTGKFDLSLIEGDIKPEFENVLEKEVIASDRLQIVVGRSHPWFERPSVFLSELKTTNWVMREPGSGTQQRFEEALINWGIYPINLNTVLVLNSGEMVKAVVEKGIGAASISELMIEKELSLNTLHAISIIDDRNNLYQPLDMVRPFFKIKHRQRFKTKISKAFEKILKINQI